MTEGYSIEAFRGDYEALERMAHASWRDEYGEASFPNFYRPAFLRYLIDRIPGEKKGSCRRRVPGRQDHRLFSEPAAELLS
jgi:hypothetical protein